MFKFSNVLKPPKNVFIINYKWKVTVLDAVAHLAYITFMLLLLSKVTSIAFESQVA